MQVEPDESKYSNELPILSESDSSKLSELLKGRELRNSFSTDILDDDSLSPMGSGGDLMNGPVEPSVNPFPEHSSPSLLSKSAMKTNKQKINFRVLRYLVEKSVYYDE